MTFRMYSNSITKSVENKAIKTGLEILGVGNVGRKVVILQVSIADISQFEAMIRKNRWSFQSKAKETHIEITVNKSKF